MVTCSSSPPTPPCPSSCVTPAWWHTPRPARWPGEAVGGVAGAGRCTLHTFVLVRAQACEEACQGLVQWLAVVLKLCTSLSCVHASHSSGSITVSIMRTLCTLRDPPACPLCRSVLSDSYRTPLHIMHPPHIVALGALCLAATITQLDLRAWLNGLDADFAAVSWT